MTVHSARPRLALTIALLVVALAVPVWARVKVRADVDKSFDFGKVRTWAWRSAGPGEVKMALTKEDNPEGVRKSIEPVIMNAVETEMTRRGLSTATAGPPDVRLVYWVLISAATAAQEFGQFASWSEWGLPPVAFGQTQSLRVLTQGSMILDVLPEGTDTPVWRGIAQAEIHPERPEAERTRRIQEAVRDLLKRLPKTARP